MGSGIGPKGLVLCSGCGLSLLGRTLSASRRPTVCHLLSVLRGFSLPVFLLLPLLGRLIRLVVLFCFVLRCLWSTLADMSTKSCYLYLLSENMVLLHCVGKFFPVYGSLDWPSTWCSLTFFDLDRQVTDLCWKIAHGVLYTAQRLVSFGLPVPPSCFCGSPVESLEHLFFFCPLAQSVLSWLQSLLFSFSFMCPALLCRHVLFGFSSDELIVTPRVFVYLLNLCKYFIWQSRNDFHFRAVRPVIARVKSRLRFHLPIFFKRFQSACRRRFFHRQWGACGVVATLSDCHLSLAL